MDAVQEQAYQVLENHLSEREEIEVGGVDLIGMKFWKVSDTTMSMNLRKKRYQFQSCYSYHPSVHEWSVSSFVENGFLKTLFDKSPQAMDKAQLLVDTFGECANLKNFESQAKATNIQPTTFSPIFSIALYVSSRSWDNFSACAYGVYDELFTSTSFEMPPILPDGLGNNSATEPEAIQILTGFKEADDQREQVRDIIVYDIPYTWDVEKILGELTLWGNTIKLSTQISDS
ncbi:hypothetical protein RhiirA4_475182 [Rhizophagus irregularis]|uniref:Uncharacterized protein n=1 Tax=Rhizophagus irregularis TaxID=588596 RepID=A0A2I1H9S6_9GLOM|nr:hypothetical protein RhiirA4_475182 [Rhizophagus irregularis]